MPTRLTPDEAAQLRSYERRRHDEMAETYIGFFAPITARAMAPLLEAAKVGPGTKVLDVATGSGGLAAEAAGRGAHVIGIDLSPGMLVLARRLHPGIDFSVGEVEHLPLPDAAVDAVVCSFGLGHFPFPEVAIAECMRTLVPGGRLALSWWDASERHRIQGLFRDAIGEIGVAPPADIPRGHSSLRFCERGEFRRLLEGAGLADVALQDYRTTHLVPDVDTLWRGGLGSLALTSSAIRNQEAQTQAAIRAALERRAAEYQTSRGLELPISFRVGAGRKPG